MNPTAVGFIILGGLLIYSAFQGITIPELLLGEFLEDEATTASTLGKLGDKGEEIEKLRKQGKIEIDPKTGEIRSKKKGYRFDPKKGKLVPQSMVSAGAKPIANPTLADVANETGTTIGDVLASALREGTIATKGLLDELVPDKGPVASAAGASGVSAGSVTGSGGWGGSEGVVNDALRAIGNPQVTSRKRPQNSVPGAMSDHWVGCTTCYAADILASGSQLDTIANKLKAHFGIKGNVVGTYARHTVNGYSIQILARVPQHFDHVHLGVRKAGTGDAPSRSLLLYNGRWL